MTGKIFVEPMDVWDFYNEHEQELCDGGRVIASREDFGVDIWLTDDGGLPMVSVMLDDEPVVEEVMSTRKECIERVSELYDEYLSDELLSTLVNEEAEREEAEQLEMIEMREEELDDAVYSFLDTLVMNLDKVADIDGLCEDVKEHICEYLFQKHGISVYRPMYLECDDGTDEFSEFPYEELDFDS